MTKNVTIPISKAHLFRNEGRDYPLLFPNCQSIYIAFRKTPDKPHICLILGEHLIGRDGHR